MPGLIGVNEFVEETREDYNSPTTSTFVSRMPQCRRTVASLEETLDYDRDGVTKMRKAIKSIHNSGNSHVDNEMYFSRVLDKLGDYAVNKDQEPDIGAAFLKFAVVTKELSALMKTLMQNINNIVMFPLETLLKGDLRGVRGDLKRPFDKAWKDYEAKYTKIEKEKKAQAKEAGLIRTEVKPAEIADELDKERKMFQLHMCERLRKLNSEKVKPKNGDPCARLGVQLSLFSGFVSVDLSTHLLKKSEGKMRRVWQKRKCCVQADGFLDICHGDETKPPTRVNLLTCQIKPVPDDKRCFDLVSCNRTYHFQAEDDSDQKAWLSVLVNCKESALLRAFDDSGKAGGGNNNNTNPSLLELQQTIIKHLTRLPGNDRCCDCNSTNDATWLCTNFGVVVCIECSGIHRDLGVHISRIQSLTLDNIGTSQLIIARHMSNPGFNEVMEAKLNIANKPNASSTMEERCEYIRAKYVEKKYVVRTCQDEKDLLSDLEHAVNNKDLYHLLQVWGEGGDLSAPLPNSNGCVTPERKQLTSHSRPSSYTESPRSRSSTCESNSKSNSYRQMPPPSSSVSAPSSAKKLTSGSSSLSISGLGTLKKRTAPLPPQYNSYGTLPGNHHARSPSDPHGYHTMNVHKRSPSSDSTKAIHLAGAKLVIPPGEIPTLKPTGASSLDKSGNIKRPQGPPPPAPAQSRISNGQPSDAYRVSSESLSSLASETEAHQLSNPVPPPRKPYFYCPLEQQPASGEGRGGTFPPPSSSPLNPSSLPRCRALYDCSADNEDELSFKEGDILCVLSSCPDDDNWMEGMLEADPNSRGMFPISFVQMLPTQTGSSGES
ncbi:arfGAP with SH3 domain, ANK repeat and PH domain-containing protein [Diaphorina citri]|uniref:ArfGAP with SH3 domain, ANK repeat and PH domain-containing protein n=1 Tax=Diaphorina citri TaxID=121845 RepID=A0A3Q0J002_DIACI|nr:arfGAP with SH3 domain, ANK repeat and PH domain-containing protein [Diaphorina citri]